MGHEWKIGDWLDFRDERQFVYRVEGILVHFVSKDGDPDHSMDDSRELTHLPDCDSWDWQPTPKLQLREGAYYELDNGKIAGPCQRRTTSRKGDPQWIIGDWWYNDVGEHNSRHDGFDVSREVPKPEPKYRPFANAEEFKPHRDRWVKNASSGSLIRIDIYTETGTLGMSWESLLRNRQFEDGTPFGVEVTEIKPPPATPV